MENQRYTKIPNTTYYKTDLNKFTMPICSAKENPVNKGHYKKFLNDQYLMVATGQENYKFKVRNVNEEQIYKNEDDMFRLDF